MAETATAEETVGKPEAPKSSAEVFAAARASIAAQPKGQDSTEAPTDDTTTEPEKPAQPPEETADEPVETVEEPDALLTPEEIAKLTGTVKAQYERMNKAFTTKTQAIAAQKKAMEEWNPLIEGLKTNPAATLEAVAKQLGFSLTKAEAKEVADTKADDLPEEWQFMKPVFEQREKALEAKLRAELEPVKKAHQEMATQAIAAETESTMKAFSAAHPGWEKHETKMLGIMSKFVPAPGSEVTDYELMEFALTLATADLSEAERTKKTIAKINKSAASTEDKTVGVQTERVVHTLPPPGKRSLRDAYEAAKRGEVWEK